MFEQQELKQLQAVAAVQQQLQQRQLQMQQQQSQQPVVAPTGKPDQDGNYPQFCEHFINTYIYSFIFLKQK